MHDNVDINYGVDFECARERLNHVAGKLFRQYREAKRDNGSEEAIAQLRQAYLDAQRAYQALSPHDSEAIRAVRVRRA